MNRREQVHETPRDDDSETVEELIAGMVREAHETGELRHLYGTPLDLGDDGPDWMARYVLKRAGATHPLLERLAALQRARGEAEAIVEQLGVRRRRLTAEGASLTSDQAEAFNASRVRAFADYRDRLDKLRRQIRDFNLAAPERLHRRPLVVDSCVARAERRVPAIQVPPRSDSGGSPSWIHRLRKVRS